MHWESDLTLITGSAPVWDPDKAVTNGEQGIPSHTQFASGTAQDIISDMYNEN